MDVTLLTEDEQQPEAHRTDLSQSVSFFQEERKNNDEEDLGNKLKKVLGDRLNTDDNDENNIMDEKADKNKKMHIIIKILFISDYFELEYLNGNINL